MKKSSCALKKLRHFNFFQPLVCGSFVLFAAACGGGSSGVDDPITPPPVTIDWQVNVDTSSVIRTLSPALIGHYDLSGALYDYGSNTELKDQMSQVGFNPDSGGGADWRIGLGRWEIGTETFGTLTDGSTCTLLEGTQSQFATDLDLIASRDWFTFTDGTEVNLNDINDSRYSLNYVRSTIDLATDFGATPFVSIDLMPRAFSVNQTPNRQDCNATFTNSINNNQPVDPAIFAAAVTGMVSRVVEGTGDGLGEQRPRNVDYWEFWNEPEFGFFWEPDLATDPDAFFNMAVATLQSLSTYRSASESAAVQDLKFGLGSFASKNTAITVINSFDAVNIPMDFISFHQYNDDPLVIVDAIESVNTTKENSTNYTEIEIALAEWGPNLDTRVADQEYATGMDAALHASTVIVLGTQVGLDRSHKALFYNYHPAIAFGLIHNDNQPRPLYRAYEMLENLIGNNNQMLSVTNLTNGRLDSGQGAVIVSQNPSNNNRQALFVNRSNTAKTARIAFNGVNTQAMELFVLDASDDPVEPLRMVSVNSNEFTVPAESLVLVVF